MSSLARLLFRLSGWKIEGTPLPSHRFVLIAAPHTSNWDAVVLLLAARMFPIQIQWFIKRSWFFFPLGTILRAVGGVPIDRSGRHGVVERAIAEFQQRERMILAVPPEGTRKAAPHWKTGFYRIAEGAQVPIVLGYLDYRRKVAGLGPALTPTGNLQADFAVFRSFYANVTAKFPEKFGPVEPPPDVA